MTLGSSQVWYAFTLGVKGGTSPITFQTESTTTSISDVNWMLMGLLVFVILFVVWLSFALDDSRLFLVAGVIAFLLATQAWTITANIPVTLAIVVLGVIMMATTTIRSKALA